MSDPITLRKPVSVADIQKSVAAAYGITVEQMLGKSVKRQYTHARHVAIYLVGEIKDNLSTLALGRLFRCHHTSIIYAYRVIRTRVLEDDEFAVRISALRRTIEAGTDHHEVVAAVEAILTRIEESTKEKCADLRQRFYAAAGNDPGQVLKALTAATRQFQGGL